MAHHNELVTQVYDVEHGNKPEFISGNFYNFHELKHERAKRPKNGKVRTYTIAERDRARATKDERRAARQATRLLKQQALVLDTALRQAETHKPKKAQATPYHKSAAARLSFDLVTA